MIKKSIYKKDAFQLLENGEQHTIACWKIKTGDIIRMRVIYIGKGVRSGNHRVKIIPSGQIREFRDITLFNIDGFQIYW